VKFSDRLKQPHTRENYYKDISLFAYPLPDEVDPNIGQPENALSGKVKITSSNPKANNNSLIDDKHNSFVRFKEATPENPQYIQVEFGEPYTCRNGFFPFCCG
jgi:hypothetical protein